MASKLLLLTLNRPDPAWDQLIQHYLQRITRFVTIEWKAIKPARSYAYDQPLAQRHATQQLLASLPPGGEHNLVVILDERGSEWTTQQLANNLTRWMDNYPRLSFLVGGAEGLDQEQLNQHTQRHGPASSMIIWSLSKLTLPHRLAQLLLVEQLYRAFSLMAHHPYHRA